MTLALLLTAVTGAWAEEKSETISTTTSQEVYTGEHFKITPNKQDYMLTVADLRNYAGGQEFFFIETLDGQNISKLDLQIDYIDDTSIDNLSLSSGTKSYDSNTKVLTITNVNDNFVQITLTEEDRFGVITISSVTYYYEESPAGPEVAWDAATKTGTFVMPAYDVEIAPIYAKAAAFATTGTEPEVKTLLPEAIEGIFAGTTDAIVKAGTVAMMGKTENPQGIVMYAVTSINQATAPELSAFNATVPTAENIADEGADVLIWYYIQGANTPDGEEATAENTFNDSEICAEPIKVTVLPNKYDIQFNAANANTIEAGKATVTVGGTAATVTEGKLKGVKMGSEVKMTAKQGYKFRKVEVKKQAADRAAAEATAEDIGKVIGADGNIYADAATATAAGATAVAMIAYVGSETGVDGYTHGLALALTDEASTMNWTNATGASGAAAHTPAAPTTTSSWMLPSKDQWNKMITAAGGYTALRDGFSGIAGASNLQSNFYWSSTEDDSNNANAWLYRFSNGQWYHDSKGYGDIRVRACLAF